MREGGQEQRAFLAILLAMGVLFAWTTLFPTQPTPTPAPGDQPATGGTSGFSEPAPEVSSVPPPGTSSGTGTPLSQDAGAVLGISTGGSGLESTNTGERVRVEATGLDLQLVLDSRGARVVEVFLPAFVENPGEPVQLLPPGGAGALGTVLRRGGRLISLDEFDFRLVLDEPSAAGRRVVFELPLEERLPTGQMANQLTIRKTFVVPNQGHTLEISQELLGNTAGLDAWGLSWAGGMRVTEVQRGASRGPYFHGTVFAEGEVKRKDPSKAKKEPIEFSGATRYVSVANKYFTGVIVPRGDQQGPARLWRVAGESEKETSLAGEILVERPAGLAQDRVDYDVYVGPLDYSAMKDLGLGIEGVVDLGAKWIRPLSRLILRIIIGMHKVIPNYGFVLLLFAIGMNLLFLPLTWTSTKSMRDMSELKPQIDALKEKHKDEPQKMSEATMRLYKEAGVNPLAGCLPLLIQMPIFFALYAVLSRTIELRQEPFILWVHDLSQPDVVFNLPVAIPFIGSGIALLPIIMGITSFLQSKQTIVDPNQKAMLYMMPIMMTVIFFTMPSGLVLYWLTSNVITIGTKFVMKPSKKAHDLAEEVPVEKGPKKGGKSGTPSKRRSKRPAKAGAKG